MKSETYASPWSMFAYDALKCAKIDAQHGDVFALAWLAVYGVLLANTLDARNGRRCILAFCAETFELMKRGQARCRFPLVLSDIATTDEFMAFAAEWCA